MHVLSPALLPQKTSSLRVAFSGARQAPSSYALIQEVDGSAFGVRAGDAELAPPKLSGSLAVNGLGGTASFRVAVDGVPVVEKVLTDGGTLFFSKSNLSKTGAHTVTVSWRGGAEPATLEGFEGLVLSVTADDFGTDVRDPNDPG